MVAFLAQALLPLLVVAAATSDFLTLRIPNWLNAVIVLAFFPMAIATGMPLDAMLWHTLAAVIVLVVGFGLFSSGIIGGGDAKLLAAVALWLGWTTLTPFIVFTSLAGGVLALAVNLWSVAGVERDASTDGQSWMRRWISTKMKLPYGMAIAAGAILAFPGSWWMSLPA